MNNNQVKSIDTAPRDGREIMILGRLNPAPDAPTEWVLGHFIDTQGWWCGKDSALVKIYGAFLWKPSLN
jgi:hypothetical protein